MSFRKVIALLALPVCFCITTVQIQARDALVGKTTPQLSLDYPAYCIAAHRVGNISLSVNNNGNLGKGWPAGGTLDCFTGMVVPSCEYPVGSDLEYLYAASLWIGAIVGDDTLVTTGADGWSCEGAEYRPDFSPNGDMIYRSTLYPEDPSVFDDAVSEEDYVAVYMDTFPYIDPNNPWLGEQHTPLNIKVTQTTYAWSHYNAEDFVILQYVVENIGDEPLTELCFGLFVDGDVGSLEDQTFYTDDITGFKRTFPITYGTTCEYEDTVNFAWIADNDGDPTGGVFTGESAQGVTGITLLRAPIFDMPVSFNWWRSNSTGDLDFAPRELAGAGVWPEDFRDFGTGGLGTPEGDRNKYYLLRNMEIDYDQVFMSSIGESDPLWMYPPQDYADQLTDGHDTKYLLSFGPIGTLHPGERMPIAFAYVGGENFHTDPANLANLPDDPESFYANLDFADISQNILNAAHVYDVPGVDTDGDGDSGRVRICCVNEFDCDTILYKGDGIPDLANPDPQASSAIWLEQQDGDLHVRWNGLRPETTPSIFTSEIEFEGYKVYLSTDSSLASFAEVGSYDAEDYRKYYYVDDHWELDDDIFTVRELRCLYGSSCDDDSFDPADYTEYAPLYFDYPDSTFYFEAFLDNNCVYGVNTDIRKTYPDQPYPSTFDPILAQPDELTDDGYLKYFEYEMTIDGLLDGECYYVYVASFDYFMETRQVPGGILCECIDLTGVGDGSAPLPGRFSLAQNYPNPFNPTTEIRFSIPRAADVTLEVFNIVGQKVATLLDRRMTAGNHCVDFNGDGLASGIYFYELKADNFTASRKMLLIK